jgi:hypothetical protein
MVHLPLSLPIGRLAEEFLTDACLSVKLLAFMVWMHVDPRPRVESGPAWRRRHRLVVWSAADRACNGALSVQP